MSSTSRNTDFRVVLNDEKVEGFAKFDISPKQTLIDLTATHSAGKSRLYYKLNKKSDRQATCKQTARMLQFVSCFSLIVITHKILFSAEGQVMWTTYGGGQLDFSSNVDIESYDNFHVLVKANSEKLELNKLKLEVGNKAVKSGAAKKINFVAQTADKKGFSGR